MMENPIYPGNIKSNIPTGFFALDPFVAEYFGFFGGKCLVQPGFLKALLRNLRIDERHGGKSRQRVARDLLPDIHSAKTDIHANCVT
jgi:hypothetical protein